jgi:ubiquinone/menaquinone biosynthesis C-methylase UbiE
MGCSSSKAGVCLLLHIEANDLSPKMLELAKTRKCCYEKVRVVDMNQLPLPYPDDSFDAVTCVGTVTYLEPAVLGKFVRITRSGRGLVCYTN